MKHLRKFNEGYREQGEQLNWNTWNNTIRRDTVPFTEEEKSYLESKKEGVKDSNYNLEIFKDYIVFEPIKFQNISHPKSEIYKHDGFFVIQRSSMFRFHGDSYQEGSRKAFKCVGNDISDVLKNYDVL